MRGNLGVNSRLCSCAEKIRRRFLEMVGIVRDNAVTRQMKCWACPDFSTHLKSDSANLRYASPHSQPRTKRSHLIFSLSLGRASNAQHRPARFRWSLMVDDAQKNPSLSFL